MPTKQELVEAVKAHALANYERGGWDMIVECYEDSELLEAIGSARSVKGAIRNVKRFAGAYDEQRRAVQNEIF